MKGGKCGDYPIKYESLDDATAAAGLAEPSGSARFTTATLADVEALAVE